MTSTRSRYRILIRNLFTGTTTARSRLYSYERARREVDEINEHFNHHEAWMEEVPRERSADRHLAGLIAWSVPCACFWGILGALIGGTVGAAAGVTVGGIFGIFAYCLFAAGDETAENEADADAGEAGKERRAA